jgi:hypothetical protein
MPPSATDLQRPARRIPPASAIGAAAFILSLSTVLCLLYSHRVLSGPGDQLTYYRQAERLVPFTDNYYGPGYFVALPSRPSPPGTASRSSPCPARSPAGTGRPERHHDFIDVSD